jgi:CRISPR-associated endonuclease Csn1
MKFKHIIGLDIGTNSLGWCLLKEFEDGTIELTKSGVHIFPIGTIVDDVSNKEKTKNEQRRAYRGASRMRYRFKLRRKNLKESLDSLGMLPDYSKLFKPHSKSEKKKLPNYLRGQSFELYKLRADAINPEIKIPLEEIGRIFMLLNKYRGFKSNSKNISDKDKEAGEVKKGYESLQELIDKSGAQTIGEYFFKMHQKARELYDANKWHNFNEPVDERAYNQESGEFVLFSSNGIRRHHGRYTLRDMYLLEFDKIWAVQKGHYPQLFTGSKAEYDAILAKPYQKKIAALKEFKKTNYWHIREYCIYYQRPLKSQRKYISNCQFERGQFEIKPYPIVEDGVEKQKEKRHWIKKAKKACPRSHPLFQEFRIWQKLHQVKYVSVIEELYKKEPLKKEWLPIIANYLNENLEISLSKPTKKSPDVYWIGKLLLDNGLIKTTDGYNFFIDESDEDVDGDDKNENRLHGNSTYARFKEALGLELFEKLKNETIEKEEHVDRNTIRKVNEPKLFQLWNTIHQSKDSLFKEDDWLKDILTERTKWKFSPEQANKLIELGLQPDYASYSSKVLKAILPFMRQGLNEHEALKATGKDYVNEDNTVGEKVQLRDKISQLMHQELRNPVVERALSKTVKLVNALLEKYKSEIDRNNLEIRIESTRQFRKPRQERENERRKNTEKDKLRKEYADYLTKKKEKLGFKKSIFQHDSIVAKYELWLQMNMNEEDELFLKEFKSFSKITKQEDKLKHQLWLECGRRCPYTGDIINFTDCFSSEIEIEHIIPLSRSLDNSFNNKTLTYRITNAEKGSMTPLEYLDKKGGDALKKFKANINSKYNNFSDSKKDLFFADKVSSDFSNNQITNTSYIAKYTRRKMQEVCKNVQFTNGSATSELRSYDWGISNLLDKIRYEEDFKINIDEYYQNYYRIKKDFHDWIKAKYKTSDLKVNWFKLSENEDLKQYISVTNNDLIYWDEGIQKFNQFRNKSGKKDRSDHRHHAIDAFVIACCSPRIIKELGTYNALREKQHDRDREKIERTFNHEQLKETIASILVSHSEKQTLIKKRKNRIKTKEGIIENSTYAPQGSLHKETFYGKLANPILQGYDKENVFVNRSSLLTKNGSTEIYAFDKIESVNKVFDINQKNILKERFDFIEKIKEEKNIQMKPFSEKAMKEYPIFSHTSNANKTKSKKGKPLPIIKSIRVKYKNENSLIKLPNGKYADKDGNYLIVLYEKKQFDKKGNKKKTLLDFKLISFWDGANLKRRGYKLFIDETEDGIGLNENCKWIQKGDLLLILKNEENEVNWADNKFISDNLYKVNELGADERENRSNAVIKFEPHKLMKTANNPYKAGTKFFKTSESINAIKVRLNILGEIEAKGKECF